MRRPGRTLTAFRAAQLLRSQGFALVRSCGSHHVWGRGPARVVLSYRRGSEEISPSQRAELRRVVPLEARNEDD
jgi:hypothetical protein